MIFIHIILILFLVVPAAYYFIFAVAGKFYRPKKRTGSAQSSFCILVPAYESDAFILPTVNAALAQDYPREKFRVVVISDRMAPQTDLILRDAGAEVLTVSFGNSTKAASLNAAAQYLGKDAADYAVILDSDNIIGPSFLKGMNEALSGRRIAVQGHRCAKNMDTPVAIADGIFEQVNNLVFRAGHCALGLSSALIGSGMVFPYGWFFRNAPEFVTAGEDKEMELKLLKDGIFVEYVPGVRILDEKTRSIRNLQKQRLRWLTSQYFLIGKALKDFPKVRLKAGYADKLLQWTFIPRILLITGLPLAALVAVIAGSSYMSLYISGTILLYAGIMLGIPEEVTVKDLLSVLKEGPRMLAATVHNIFCKKMGKDRFIHTEHS